MDFYTEMPPGSCNVQETLAFTPPSLHPKPAFTCKGEQGRCGP